MVIFAQNFTPCIISNLCPQDPQGHIFHQYTVSNTVCQNPSRLPFRHVIMHCGTQTKCYPIKSNLGFWERLAYPVI